MVKRLLRYNTRHNLYYHPTYSERGGARIVLGWSLNPIGSMYDGLQVSSTSRSGCSACASACSPAPAGTGAAGGTTSSRSTTETASSPTRGTGGLTATGRARTADHSTPTT
jgi:hypothetical protein